MSTLTMDLRLALRTLAKSPGFLAVAVLTLALGVGANTVIFTGAYWVLFETLPYPEADRLAVLYQIDRAGTEAGVSYPDFVEWKAAGDVLLEAGVTRTQGMALEGRDEDERVTTGLVSPEVMPMLGGRALLGRTFGRADFHPDAGGTVILSHSFWQARFGGASDVIGRRLTLSGREATVVGIMAPGFSYPFRAEVWLPLGAWEAPSALRDPSSTGYEVLARLRPGVGLEAAASRAELLSKRVHGRSGAGQRELSVRAARLRDTLPSIAKYRRTVLVLQLAVALVLLIACVNLANLLLARNIGRRQELAVRVALGGRPGRLVRLLLSESLLLGLLGTVVGLLVAKWGVDALRTAIVWRPAGLPEGGVNMPVLLVALSLGVATSLVFGLAPARLAAKFDLCSQLKSASGQATPERRGRGLSRGLVVAESALAVVLLAVTGATIRTLMELARFDPGFHPESAVVVSYTRSSTAGLDGEGRIAHYSEVLRRVREVAGVEAAGGISYPPIIGYNPEVELELEGSASPGPNARLRARFQAITPEYFWAMGIPMVGGRVFGASDMRSHPDVVIVSREFARRYLPSQQVLGRGMQLRDEKDAPGLLTIVGVVESVRPFGPLVEPSPELYLPLCRQSMALVVRTRERPADMVPALRTVVKGVAGDQAVFSVKTMPQMMAEGRARRHVFAWLLGGMAAIALLLTALGIYGVVSQETATRTREIGLRMALGATARSVFGLVLGQGLRLAAVGIVSGSLGAYAMMRVMRSLPFRLQPLDPVTLTCVGVLVAAVALAACLFPARRAAQADPLTALRCE